MSSLTERLRALPRYEPVRFHDVHGERGYTTPAGALYGITTILSGSRDNSGLETWRESVGPERADFISSLACFRGTGTHTNVENYLRDGVEPAFDYLMTPYWKSVRPFLDNVAQPLLMEGAVWHPDGFAGTLDCIAYLTEDDLQPTLLDWKTADSPRKPDKLYEYSLQVAAYVAAANHVYAHLGLNITQAKIVVAIADSAAQIETVDADALSQLYRHFLARLRRFTFARQSRAKKS